MYRREHGVPHFRVRYGSQRASISVIDLRLLEGQLPQRITALVLEWAFLHRDELLENWNLAMIGKPLKPIKPLE